MNHLVRRALSYGLVLLVLAVALVAFATAPTRINDSMARPNGPILQRTTPTTQPTLTATATLTPTNTSTVPTATHTPVPPTATNTPTATKTAIPPTATNTSVPVAATNTPVPAAATSTSQPAATNTPVPVATITPLLGGVAATATSTPIPQSALPKTGGSPFTWIAVGLVLVLIVFGARVLRQTTN